MATGGYQRPEMYKWKRAVNVRRMVGLEVCVLKRIKKSVIYLSHSCVNIMRPGMPVWEFKASLSYYPKIIN